MAKKIKPIKHKMKKVIFPVIVIIVGLAAFYGGMTYGKSQASSNQNASRDAFAGAQNFAGVRGRSGGSGGNGGGFISGQIISKDSQSITVEFRNGSSTASASSTKIVFLSGSTPIMKSVNGTADDLTPGTSVTITGTANSDGSITAQSIQIRPASAQPTSPVPR